MNLLEIPLIHLESRRYNQAALLRSSIAMQFEQNGTILSKPFSIPDIPK